MAEAGGSGAAPGVAGLAQAGPGAPPGAAASPHDLGDCACETVRREDLACPVCFELLTDPFVTACGHSFCYTCISRHLEHAKNCPSCSHYLSADLIYPNFLLSKIVKRARSRALDTAPPALELLQQAISDHAGSLAEADLDALLRQLWEHKQARQEQQREASMELLLHFLQSSRRDKVQRLEQLQRELMCLEGDILRVEAAGVGQPGGHPNGANVPAASHQARPATPSGSGWRPGAAAAAAAANAEAATVPTAMQQPEDAAGRQQPAAAQLAAVAEQDVQAMDVAGPGSGAAPAAAAVEGRGGPAPAAGAQPASGASLAAAAAAQAVGTSVLHHHQLFQQQQQQAAAMAGGQLMEAAQAQVEQQQQRQQQRAVADFATAAFASLAGQAMVPPAGGGGGGAAAGAAATQAMQIAHGSGAAAGHAPAAPGAFFPPAPAAPAAPAAGQHPGQHHGAGPQAHHQHAFTSMLGSLLSPGASHTTSSGGAGGVASSSGRAPRDVLSLLRNKKRRIATQFDDLQQCYLQLRARQLQQQQAAGGPAAEGVPPSDAAAAEAAHAAAGDGFGHAVAAAAAAAGMGGEGPLIDEGLQEFSRLLSVITRCNKLKLVAEVPRSNPSHRGGASIISSLEFDKEGALFATAGVSKRISVYEFAGVVPQAQPQLSPRAAGLSASAAPAVPPGGRSVSAPVVELLSRSKLSCLSWNKYIQAHIASSDYEGVVSVWDVSSAALLHEYEAHSKRIWSVDFCAADPTLLASGSDDCAVKFWSTKSPSSVAQVDTSANVCAVRWRPGSSHELAVGSADHCVYLYDMRNTSGPVATFQGHRKAVSYVRFCNAGELVSASTDSTLRLWALDDAAAAAAAAAPRVPGSEAGGGGRAVRVYEGHSNEKNFVGLAVDGDFLACGSESSELFVYYKALSKPVAQQGFGGGGDDGGDAQSDKGFISAVCWRPGAHTLLAANSQGTVKVFSLTGSGAHT